MLCNINVNRSLSANLAVRFVGYTPGSCVVMRVVMVLGQAAASLWSMFLELKYDVLSADRLPRWFPSSITCSHVWNDQFKIGGQRSKQYILRGL